MVRIQSWEFAGQLLCAGAAFYALAFAAPSLVSLNVTFRTTFFAISPQGALGVAGLSVTAMGSLVAIILGGLRPHRSTTGALLLFWTDLAVLLVGDIVFYAEPPAETTVMLIGAVSGLLTAAGLLVVAQSQVGAGPANS